MKMKILTENVDICTHLLNYKYSFVYLLIKNIFEAQFNVYNYTIINTNNLLFRQLI